MNKKLFLLTALFFFVFRVEAQDYEKLDHITDNFDKVITDKQKRIAVLLEGDRSYGLYNRLFSEYMSFKYDSAYKYVTESLRMANSLNDKEKIYDCLLKYAHILSVAGHFQEAVAVLGKINPDSVKNNLKTAYFANQADLFLYRSEFTEESEFFLQMRDSSIYYHKKIIEYSNPDCYEYTFSKAVLSAEEKDFVSAINTLENYLNNNKPNSRTYSIITGTLAYYYLCLGQMETAEKYYLLSAENDLENAIIENNSLRRLAEILFDKGDYQRAFKYLMICSQCANFYGSKLRNVQIAKIHDKIITSYSNEKKNVHNRTLLFLVIISVVAFVLVFLTIKLISKNKRYIIANHKITVINNELDSTLMQLKVANNSLKEYNKIKDEYIGRFMEVCSMIIENACQKHKIVNKLAREKKMAELYAEIKNEDFITENTKLFYDNFDEAFLNLFPDFGTKVNGFLKPEFQFVVKDKTLTTELRILALLRLGFSDNKQIASILRSSITTIYTYRSKIRSKALDKDGFEDAVKSL